MKRKIIVLMSAIALLSSAPVWAQSTVMNLKQILDYAIKHNQDANKARLEVENGRYVTNEVRAQALPQINGNASLTDNLIKPRFVLPGTLAGRPGENIIVESGTTWNAAAGVSLSQQLFNQSVFTGLKAAKVGEDFYQLSAALTEEQVIEQVASAYYQLLVNQEQVAVIDANLNNVIQLQKTIASQYENGLVKKTDRDRVQVNLTNLQTQKQQLTDGIRQMENMLKFYMGMPLNTAVSFERIPLNDLSKEIVPVKEETVNAENITSFVLLKKQRELLTLQKKAYQAEYYPSLSLSGNYSYNGLSDKFDLFKTANTSAFWYDMASVGLTLRVPIFDGNARGSKVKQANIALLKIDQDLSTTQQSVDLAYQNASIQMSNSINTIRVQEANVKLANEVYQTTQSNYKNGLANLTDLLNSESSMVEAQNSYNQALLNYKLAEIQLIKSQGKIKTLNQ